MRYVQLGNTGLGDLDYKLSIEYHRPGISYSSVKQTTPVNKEQYKTKRIQFVWQRIENGIG